MNTRSRKKLHWKVEHCKKSEVSNEEKTQHQRGSFKEVESSSCIPNSELCNSEFNRKIKKSGIRKRSTKQTSQKNTAFPNTRVNQNTNSETCRRKQATETKLPPSSSAEDIEYKKGNVKEAESLYCISSSEVFNKEPEGKIKKKGNNCRKNTNTQVGLNIKSKTYRKQQQTKEAKTPLPKNNEACNLLHDSDHLLQLNHKEKAFIKSGCSSLSDNISFPNTNDSIISCTITQENNGVPTNIPRSNDSSESSESEWEEVASNEQECTLEDYNPQIPKQGVEITIDAPFNWKKKHRNKRQFDCAAFLRRHINRLKREVQIDVHKTHLLYYLVHGIKLYNIITSDLLKGIALSVIPSDIITLSTHTKMGMKIISDVLEWYSTVFSFHNNNDYQLCYLNGSLVKGFEEKNANNICEFTFIFLIIVNTLGFDVRLCISLCPVSLKPSDILHPKKRKSSALESDQEQDKIQESCSSTNKSNNAKVRFTKSSTMVRPNDKVISMYESRLKYANEKKNINSAEEFQKFSSVASSYDTVSDDEVAFIQEVKSPECKLNINKKQKIEDEPLKEENQGIKETDESSQKKTSGVYTDSDSDFIDDSDIDFDDDSDDDFVINANKSKRHKKEVRKKITQPLTSKTSSGKKAKKKKNRKILSSDSEDSIIAPLASGKGIEHWVEIYLEDEKEWICVDCINRIINKPYEIEEKVIQPLSYVLAFKNGFVKDVTRRYSSRWMTGVKKLRVDPEWWEDTLRLFSAKATKKDHEEEKKLDTMLLKKPMPLKVTEFKNHPLYALKRHLLKFEAIYPPDAPSLGFIRGEPVYARECVQLLHSRENWMKEARVVRIGEQPYKVVKGRRKWDKLLGTYSDEKPLELFGKWQTEEYIPPIAHDGKVPRNEYGNVELFQPCMLPQGTVHLLYPALNRVAKKLGIDCVPALVGFDGHGGGVHPVFDGWIVCKEFEDVLIAAWQEEQVNIRKREQEKREKRVYGNWKKLIKGLLIREKLKIKYDLKNNNTS